MDIEKYFEKLEQVFEGEGRVLFAYLHGSYAEGVESELSDLDLAVFTDKEIGLKERARLARKLSKKLGIEVDISVLNNTSTGFRHQVLKKGELIFSRDDEKRRKFEEEVYRKYLDMKPFMERFNEVRRSA